MSFWLSISTFEISNNHSSSHYTAWDGLTYVRHNGFIVSDVPQLSFMFCTFFILFCVLVIIIACNQQ